MDYLEAIEKARERGHALLNDKTGWKLSSKSTENLRLETRSSDRLNCTIYKTEQYIKAPAKLVKDSLTFLPGGRRKEWDNNVNEMTILKNFDDRTLLFLNRSNGMAKGLISPREFIDAARIEETEDGGYLIVGTSVDYPDIPVTDKYVRAVSGLVFMKIFKHPDKPGFTTALMMSEIDLKGNIPKFLLDSAIPSIMFSSDTEWRKYIEKQGNATD